MVTGRYERWLERHSLERVRRLAEEGYTLAEIAAELDTDEKTLRKWQKKHPELAEAIALGREGADFEVVRALYKKATGYNVALNKTYKLRKIDYDPDTGKKLREYEEIATGVDETYVPADLRAETFWLKNRQPDRWSDKPDRALDEDETGGGIIIPDADLIDPAD